MPLFFLYPYLRHSPSRVYKGYEYSRFGNPTMRWKSSWRACSLGEARLSLLVAEVLRLVQIDRQGGRVLSVNDVYGGAWRYLKCVMGEF